MNEPRFYVSSVGGGFGVSYSVLDAAYCHREVYYQDAKKGGEV